MKATHQHVGLVAAVVIALVIVAYFVLNPSSENGRPGVHRSLQIPGQVQLLPYFSRTPAHIQMAPGARQHAPTR